MTPAGVLRRAAWITLGFTPLLALGIWLDPFLIDGVSRWLKPLKFFTSVPVFYLTVAWFLHQLDDAAAKPARRIAWGVTLCLAIENVLILMQAMRGVRSHFNVSTPFDNAVFQLMGIFIVTNTGLLAWLLVVLWRRAKPMPPALLWGLRAGALLAILGSLEGFAMVARRSHSVEFGDLRIAHFVALHGFQALPLAGWLLSRSGTPRGELLVAILFLAWLGVSALVYLQALAGKPLFL